MCWTLSMVYQKVIHAQKKKSKVGKTTTGLCVCAFVRVCVCWVWWSFRQDDQEVAMEMSFEYRSEGLKQIFSHGYISRSAFWGGSVTVVSGAWAPEWPSRWKKVWGRRGDERWDRSHRVIDVTLRERQTCCQVLSWNMTWSNLMFSEKHPAAGLFFCLFLFLLEYVTKPN